MKKRLGELLLERGVIDADQLNAALSHQRQWGTRLGTALVAKGFIAEGTLTQVLSEHMSIPLVDLSKVIPEPRALAAVNRRLCEQHDVLPLSIKEHPTSRRKTLVLAMADPMNAAVLDEIGFAVDAAVQPCIAQISSLQQAIRKYLYGQRVDISAMRETPKETDEPMQIIARGQISGVEPMPRVKTATTEGAAVSELDILATRAVEEETLEKVEALEKKFWALLRVLARRGLLQKEEFLAELRAAEQEWTR
jgi:Type II secretion system (T2SS), protein E, N-terminal domain